VHNVKPTTAQPVRRGVRNGIVKEEKSNTYVQDPAKTGAFDNTSVVKGLYPESESKTPPCAYTIYGSFPKKDGNGTTCDTCDGCRKYKHAYKGLSWWINGRENAEFQDEDSAYEG
jgi:hypothetical protein